MTFSRNPRLITSDGATPPSPADAIPSMPHWQHETRFTDPEDVMNWLTEGASRVNGGKPLTTNSTDILRAAREARYIPGQNSDDGE